MKGNQLRRSPKQSREVPATTIAAVAVEMMVKMTESVICLLVVVKVMVSVKWKTWEKLKKVDKTIIKSRNRVLQ